MGCLTYIDVFQFIMPNNSFAVSMAFKSIEESLKVFDCWKGECVGIQPDIICSDEDVLPVLKKITKDKNLRFENIDFIDKRNKNTISLVPGMTATARIKVRTEPLYMVFIEANFISPAQIIRYIDFFCLLH